MDPKKGKKTTTGIVPRVRTSIIQGGAVGNFTLTGIKQHKDFIVSVIYIPFPSVTPWAAPSDISSEFSISADNTITNTTTNTTNGLLLVTWYNNDWGVASYVLRD